MKKLWQLCNHPRRRRVRLRGGRASPHSTATYGQRPCVAIGWHRMTSVRTAGMVRWMTNVACVVAVISLWPSCRGRCCLTVKSNGNIDFTSWTKNQELFSNSHYVQVHWQTTTLCECYIRIYEVCSRMIYLYEHTVFYIPLYLQQGTCLSVSGHNWLSDPHWFQNHRELLLHFFAYSTFISW